MSHNCEPFAVTDTFEVVLSSSFLLSLLLSSLTLSLLVNGEFTPFVVVVHLFIDLNPWWHVIGCVEVWLWQITIFLCFAAFA